MSHWGGDGPPLAPPSDSAHQTPHNDVSFIILSLSIIAQQLSAVLASQLSSQPPPSSSSVSSWLVQALSNISATTYYLSFAQTAPVTTQQSPHTNSHSSSLQPSSQVSTSSLPPSTSPPLATTRSPEPPSTPVSAPSPGFTTKPTAISFARRCPNCADAGFEATHCCQKRRIWRGHRSAVPTN